MRYFKYRWNETRGDQFDNWGFITFYQELDEEFQAVRQIEIYENGIVLKYNQVHSVDEFGMMADQSLEEVLEDSKTLEISKEEFEYVWKSHNAFNIDE